MAGERQPDSRLARDLTARVPPVQVTQDVEEIGDRLEVREVGALDLPVVLLPVSQERLPGRVEKATRLRLRRRHRPEGPAVAHAGHTGPHLPPGRPR